MTAARKSGRTRDLAAIHVMTKQLRLDRGTYECLLMRVSGVRSSADLDVVGRAKVIAELKRLGAPKNKTAGRPANIGNEPMIRKIEALLAELDAPWAYADGIAKRMFGIAFVAWVRKPEQLRSIIAALDARRLKKQQLEAVQMNGQQEHPKSLDWIKRQAKRIKKDQGIQHARALDEAAKQSGFVDFRHARTVLAHG